MTFMTLMTDEFDDFEDFEDFYEFEKIFKKIHSHHSILQLSLNSTTICSNTLTMALFDVARLDMSYRHCFICWAKN